MVLTITDYYEHGMYDNLGNPVKRLDEIEPIKTENRDKKYKIVDFTPRLYQETIFANASKKNSLIVLPTGLGKTNIFVMIALHRLKSYPDSKILLLGPTRPLIDQYKQVFEKYTNIPQEKMVVFTGMIKPEKREKLWKEKQIIFSTPQGLENDLIGGRIKLTDVSLIGFDEAHRAVGEYSYVWIAKQYEKTGKYPRIVGMTASPGSDMETITEVCQNLHIEDVEARNEKDSDVKPYIQDVKIKWMPVELSSDMKRIKSFLDLCFKQRVERLQSLGVVRHKLAYMSRKDMIALQGQLQARISQGEKDVNMWTGISTVAEAMKIQHGLELIESQGISPLLTYLEKLEKESYSTRVKAVKNLVIDTNFRHALALARIMEEKKIKHPKIPKLINILKEKIKDNKENGDGHFKAIVFTQYRDTGSNITEELTDAKIKSQLFVGQMKKGNTGLSQKDQKKAIERFKNNEFQILVSTSVGEEGLDIPSVDLVMFYEPVPSAIRTVQRRGRTGRQSKGEVNVLYTKGTRDESYKWASHHKEKRMNVHLKSLKDILAKTSHIVEMKLDDFSNEKITIYVDHREKGSRTIKNLIEQGVEIKLEQLPVGDYILSKRCAIEFKTVEDFASSIADGRLLSQLQDLKRNYQRPLVLVEGTEDIYSVRNIHPNAIRGMISTIMISYGIPILRTKDSRETSEFIKSIAKREQDQTGKIFNPHSDKKVGSIKEQQEYVVSSLPGIGPNIAEPLLNHFGSVRNVMNATEDELKKVPLVGKKKAESIQTLLDTDYEKNNQKSKNN